MCIIIIQIITHRACSTHCVCCNRSHRQVPPTARLNTTRKRFRGAVGSYRPMNGCCGCDLRPMYLRRRGTCAFTPEVAAATIRRNEAGACWFVCLSVCPLRFPYIDHISTNNDAKLRLLSCNCVPSTKRARYRGFDASAFLLHILYCGPTRVARGHDEWITRAEDYPSYQMNDNGFTAISYNQLTIQTVF